MGWDITITAGNNKSFHTITSLPSSAIENLAPEGNPGYGKIKWHHSNKWTTTISLKKSLSSEYSPVQINHLAVLSSA